MGLLDSAGGRRRLPRRLGGELLAGGLAAGGLSGCLLGSGHRKRQREGRFEIRVRVSSLMTALC